MSIDTSNEPRPTPSANEVNDPALRGKTVVVIGGSSGIGFETARQARAKGANVIVTARDSARLARAAEELGATRGMAFDATDPEAVATFFRNVPTFIDHVMVTAGRPHYQNLLQPEFDETRRAFDEHIMVMVTVARHAASRITGGGTLLFMGGTDSRRPGLGIGVESTTAAALPALVANLALELAPVRVNLISAGFVDTPLSASILGADLDRRRAQLRATLPIRRVVEPRDVAALAVHMMLNTAITGATYDIDGGQHLIARG